MFKRSVLLLPLLLASSITTSAEADEKSSIDTMVVTATRVRQPSFDLPVAISSVNSDAIRNGNLKVNLSESLDRVPGLVVQNRQNYAQDLQISSRGFGARSTFGVRGVRVYVDGIPGTMPDGQGQTSQIDLGSADHIEVLRGPFSALYGNSSGGVISVFTENGEPGISTGAEVETGSFGLLRYGAKASGQIDDFNYVLNAARFQTDGYRDHSEARRTNFNSKLRLALDPDSELTLIANAVDISRADDPLGLTHAQYDADPTQAGTGALAFNTRKTVRQKQAGLVYKRQIGAEDTLNAIIYGGHRDITQYLAIPVAAQLAPTSAGGVVDLSNDFWGTDVNWTHQTDIAGLPFQITAGVSYDALNGGREGYNNFIGSMLGVRGALRRDETDKVYNVDEYAQAQLDFGQWLLQAGLRHSRVEVDINDHLSPPGPGNNSGNATYDAVNPVAGLTYRLTPSLNAYVSYGRGFETPTLNELAYKSTSGTNTGLNLGLQPATSNNYELGLKAAISGNMKAGLSLFHIDTRNEIVVAANSGGRSVFQNVASTTRNGVEASFEGHWDNGIGVALSYTLTRVRYDKAFTTCPGSPCPAPLTVAAGNAMPGVPEHIAYGELSWRHEPSGFSTAFEMHAESHVYVDDVNSDAAPGFVTADWHAGFTQSNGCWSLKEFMRIDNLTDHKYAGSVITNESNGRYFEPAPGRAFYGGVSAEFRW